MGQKIRRGSVGAVSGQFVKRNGGSSASPPTDPAIQHRTEMNAITISAQDWCAQRMRRPGSHWRQAAKRSDCLTETGW